MSQHRALSRKVRKLADVLRELFQDAQVSNEEEALFIAVYAFALDLGFNSQNKLRREILPSNWRHGHYYSCKLEHQTCPDAQCRLLYTPVTTDLATLYGFVNDEEVCKLPICQKNFISKRTEGISSSNGDLNKEGNIYKDIDSFSRIVKDNILFQMLFFAQQSVGLPATFGFMTAPNEIVLRIFEYLPAKSLLIISEVNKEFYELAQLPHLWERLFKKDFSDSEDVATASTSWKDLYKEKYVQRKRREEMMRNATFVLPRPFIPHLSDPEFSNPFGIIGGDRDRFPNLGLHPDVAEAFPNLVRRRPPLRFPHLPNFSM